MAQSAVALENASVGPRIRRRWSPSRRREALIAYAFLTPFIIFFAAFILKGVIYGVQLSFYNWNILAPVHKYLGLGNFQELLNDKLWWTSLENTILFAVMTVAGTTVVALATALAVNQRVRGRDFFRAVFYAPGLFSVGVTGIIWQWMLDTQFGVINYGLKLLGLPTVSWLGDAHVVLFSLSLTTIWWGFGFPMLIFLAGLQNIPDTLYEAARIDGANRRQVFRFITLPLLRPTILFVTVTGFIAHFQVFGQSYIMTGGGPGTASYTVIIYLFQVAWRYLRAGYGSAIAVALALIMIAITVVQFVFFGRRADQ
ncbi:MAG: carbohydrate ABC transporter permease [Aggregatilineales bacterium]